ncbi:HNH/endonuclease VII fold putative polymorphic toxin [Streptomyces sp. NRRL F-5053]|uniref:HNH/endonuclease VII fold putative polymorphic toxin n=1 Tax=Streptomyces sp. NRRL F-5053 TaxID=1463854 RepID=UPI0018FFEEC9|nr:HNH/endonuclease VII fold putative polymorphic toxin [Streptomyces sp. NRRL F-5053]
MDSRRLAFNTARERAGVPNSQQPVKQWTVGGDPAQRHRTSNYVYDENPGAHGRYYQYETPEGTRLVVEHTADPHAPHPHFHAGKPKGGGHNIDMRNEKYQQVGVKHHIYYKE